MTTTKKTDTSSVFPFAVGLNKAAFTQLTGCSVTRSGTTATLTKNGHGLSNGDLVFIDGFNLTEYNGIFTVANSQTNTFDYTIKQDPGANSAGSTGTVDKAVVSASVDLRTALGAFLAFEIQNTTTGPTVAPTVAIGSADTDVEAEYWWHPLFQGHTVANYRTSFRGALDVGERYVKVAMYGNTAQAVDYKAMLNAIASLTTT